MKILFVTSEAHPLIKTGGLADVAGALPAALAERGEDVRILLPAYPQAVEKVEGLQAAHSLGEFPGLGKVRLLEGWMPDSGVPVYLVDCPVLFNRSGGPYQDESGNEWGDNLFRFAFFSRIAAQLATIGIPASGSQTFAGWQPDVVHLNDWQAGLVPAYLHSWGVTKVKTVYTIHNLQFQGRYPAHEFWITGLPEEQFSPNGVEFNGELSLMKSGLYYSNKLTTVSPTYAHEIQSGVEMGMGMEGILASRSHDLTGILNGIDTKVWNPETDPMLPFHFSATRLERRHQNKRYLQQEMGLPMDPEPMLVGLVSRLSWQKGIDLMIEAMPDLIIHGGVQFAILGSGDKELEQRLLSLQARWPDQVSICVAYDEPLAHRIMGGADILMVPSRFEPCGLTQMYALRYGALPLVRRTGGLADTVNHENGFLFDDATVGGVHGTLWHSLDIYKQPELWRSMQRRAMAGDFSWQQSAQRYLELYR